MKKLIATLSIVITGIVSLPISTYADVDGIWHHDSIGQTYILAETNTTPLGWMQIDGSWYYFENNGYMKQGWILENEQWYYLLPDGKMVTGWNQIDGLWYCFSESGSLLSNTTTSEGYLLSKSADIVSEPIRKTQVNDPASSTLSAQEKNMVSLINEERAKVGLPLLDIEAYGSSASEVRATELVESFGHVRPNGSRYETVLDDAGLDVVYFGENATLGRDSIDSVMKRLMDSEAHAKNILCDLYTHVGIAHTIDTDGNHYWVQLFYTLD